MPHQPSAVAAGAAALLALAACAATTVTVAADTRPHLHDWSRAQTWVEFSFSTRPTDAQIAFVANHYDLVGVGACLQALNMTAEETFAETAKRLKAANPTVTVLWYQNSQVSISGPCYAADAEFEAHPQWWVRNDTGGVIYDGAFKYINASVPAARQWFVSTAVGVMKKATLQYADGVWQDGSGVVVLPQLSAPRLAALQVDHQLMVQQVTDALHALRPSPPMLNLGNGLTEYGFNPDHGIGDLANVDGSCTEHFGAFETVDHVTGAMNGTMMESWVDVVTQASALRKIVIVKAWPGPVTTPLVSDPGGGVGPTWPNQTNWTYATRRAASARGLEWSLAAYLLAASPYTYFCTGWWYDIENFVPCLPGHGDGDGDSNGDGGGDGDGGVDLCQSSTPDDWYPALAKATGAPLGPPKRVAGAGSGHVWTREFASASVRVDLGDQSAASITWK